MSVHNSAVIPAPVGDVWKALSNFHDMSWAAGVIEKVDKVGDKAANQVGAKRVLNGAFQETLLSLDAGKRTFTYSIDDGPDAVSKENVTGYVGKVQVHPVTETDQTFVVWSSSWESGGDGTKEFCDPIYRALLGALREHFS